MQALTSGFQFNLLLIIVPNILVELTTSMLWSHNLRGGGGFGFEDRLKCMTTVLLLLMVTLLRLVKVKISSRAIWILLKSGLALVIDDAKVVSSTYFQHCSVC